MSTALKDLFDDDSSSSSEEEEEAETQRSVPEAPKEDDRDAATTTSKPTEETTTSFPQRAVLEGEETEKETVSNNKDEAASKVDSFANDVEMKDASEDPAASEQQKPEAPPQETAGDEKGSDDDEDDDEPEFDDEGNIVGTSAPPASQQDEEVAATDEAAAAAAKTRPKKPRHMQVLQAERPSASLHMTKLPNLVGIQPEAFDEDTYSHTLEERDYRGYVHSMIRWRYVVDPTTGELKRDESGKLLRESNARIVKWEDGSYTLHVGNEVFDMDAIDSSTSDFAGLNGYLYMSQKATFKPEEEEKEDIPGGTVLECMGAIQSRLIPRPSSLQSEAHKQLTVAVRQRTIKKARIAEYVTQEDPEKAKMEKIKVKDDLEKASARKSRAYRSSGVGRRATPGMNRRYLEEDDGNYDTTSIRGLKRKNMDELMDYGDDSEEDDDADVPWAKKPTRGARDRRGGQEEKESEDEEEFVIGGDSSDEEEFAPAKKPASGKKASHQAVFDDDDDD
jgi:RNA polymerase-associated protein LEO1